MAGHDDIRIGTMAGKDARTAEYIEQIAPLGFECFEINFWQELPKGLPLKRLAKQVHEAIDRAGTGQTISSLAMFGNPLMEKKHAQAWARCIDAAEDFGTDLVCGFAGGIVGQPVPESIKTYKKVFGPLAKRAADKGVRLAFENCPMGSTWHNVRMNIAFNPDAWELMFDALPADNIGLEWEPCHQLCQLIDPLPQLSDWISHVFQIHGKDATVDRSLVESRGIIGAETFAHHRTPGFGDTNWTDLISILRRNGFKGDIVIEGWHDPVYRGKLEMTGQVYAANYLKQCRGGAFVPNPKGF